jgi:hypothetical protein
MDEVKIDYSQDVPAESSILSPTGSGSSDYSEAYFQPDCPPVGWSSSVITRILERERIAVPDGSSEQYVENLSELYSQSGLSIYPTLFMHCHESKGLIPDQPNVRKDMYSHRFYTNLPEGYGSDAFNYHLTRWQTDAANDVTKRQVPGLSAKGLTGRYLINHNNEEWFANDRVTRARSLLKDKAGVREIKRWINRYVPFMADEEQDWILDANSLVRATPLNATYLRLLADDPFQVERIWKRNYRLFNAQASLIIQDYKGPRIAVIDTVEKKSVAAKLLNSITSMTNASEIASVWGSCLMCGPYVEVEITNSLEHQCTYLQLASLLMTIYIFHPWFSSSSWSNIYSTLYRLEFKAIVSSFDAAGRAAITAGPFRLDTNPPITRAEYIDSLNTLINGIRANAVRPWNGNDAEEFVKAFKPDASYICRTFPAGVVGHYDGADIGGDPAHILSGTYMSYSSAERRVAFPVEVTQTRSNEAADNGAFMTGLRAKMLGLSKYPDRRLIFKDYSKLIQGTQGMSSICYAISQIMYESLLSPDFIQGHHGHYKIFQNNRTRGEISTGPANVDGRRLIWQRIYQRIRAGGEVAVSGPYHHPHCVTVDMAAPLALLNSSWGKIWDGLDYTGPLLPKNYFYNYMLWERLARSMLDCTMSSEAYSAARESITVEHPHVSRKDLADRWLKGHLGDYLKSLLGPSRMIIPVAANFLRRAMRDVSQFADDMRTSRRLLYQRSGVVDGSETQPCFPLFSQDMGGSVVYANGFSVPEDTPTITDFEYVEQDNARRLPGGIIRVNFANRSKFAKYVAGQPIEAALTPPAVTEPEDYNPNETTTTTVSFAVNYTANPVPEVITYLKGKIGVSKWVAVLPEDSEFRLFHTGNLFERYFVLNTYPKQTTFNELEFALLFNRPVVPGGPGGDGVAPAEPAEEPDADPEV